MLGDSGGTAAVLGALPDVTTTEDEALNFVETLLENDSIQTTPAPPRPRAAVATSRRHAIHSGGPIDQRRPTFAVVMKRGQKTLERVRYRCGCGGAQ